MAIKGLLDTKLQVFRSVDSSDKYGDTVAFAPVLTYPSMKAIFTNPLRLGYSDSGPGGMPTGHMIMLTEKKYVLKEGDILQYVSGTPLAHTKWEIMTIYRPKNKLGEYHVKPYKGKALP